MTTPRTTKNVIMVLSNYLHNRSIKCAQQNWLKKVCQSPHRPQNWDNFPWNLAKWPAEFQKMWSLLISHCLQVPVSASCHKLGVLALDLEGVHDVKLHHPSSSVATSNQWCWSGARGNINKLLFIVVMCSILLLHILWSGLQVSQIGFCLTGSISLIFLKAVVAWVCYCNKVIWVWLTNHYPSVLWHCWLGQSFIWPVKSSPKWPIMCR